MKKILIGILLLVAFSALAGDSLNSEKEMLDLANKVMSKFHTGDFNSASKEVVKKYIDSKNIAAVESMFNKIKESDKYQMERLGKKVGMLMVKSYKNRDFFFNNNKFQVGILFFRKNLMTFLEANTAYF